ncbi:Uncharacterized protein TPAR_05713 [Tolypocladium paradoxum]|uniref:Amidohydrolase-related domain-containing protein n=1 Tax=Tolypocladium paradoxum TaxID=94208 RepID=A0A2S4KV49_9HYPO|nr:Uncharacterized protein TPAR_05713 [Tolypocladium paradoxum]
MRPSSSGMRCYSTEKLSFPASRCGHYLSKGFVVSISEASRESPTQSDAVEHHLHGRYVTLGLVDMHSHHMIASWPAAGARAEGTARRLLSRHLNRYSSRTSHCAEPQLRVGGHGNHATDQPRVWVPSPGLSSRSWQIPEALKEKEENVTLAIFAEFSLYKWEAYSPSLCAGHLLDKHGIPVAYKSDGPTNAKYLASQSAIGHSFHLPEDKALQAISSIPAKAIDLDHRVGYYRPGYDADLVVWGLHPLSVGATPLQVFVDGVPQLDDSKPQKGDILSAAEGAQSFIIKGIHKTFLENYPALAAFVTGRSEEPLDLVIDGGNIVCLGPAQVCAEKTKALEADGRALKLSLQNGHVLPGLTAVTKALGTRKIAAEEETGDGDAKGQKIGDAKTVAYAKHGIWLDGKSFARARMGGVTRAITAPVRESGGMVQGVSVEILTGGKKILLDGGIVQDDVALHLVLDEGTKASEDTVGAGVQHLRKMLQDGKGKQHATIYGKVQRGELPLVVTSKTRSACRTVRYAGQRYADTRYTSQYDLQQLTMIKRDFPGTELVIMGGKEAPYVRCSWKMKSDDGEQVAKDLAAANIQVILAQNRPSGDEFRSRDAVMGPPLSRSRSIASHLTEAGVTFALELLRSPCPWITASIRSSLGPEAGWAAKYAGLNERETVRLVTTNVESILGLKKSKDLVVFEGSPLQYGATAVLSFHAGAETGKLEVATCFPREE